MESSDLTHQQLAGLCREYLLAGHLIDRAGIPYVIEAFGREEMQQIAIEEWMGASPVYSQRMQKLLSFGNGDVETIFKNIQLDIGAPPEFMDFQFRVDGPTYGEFWLDHCGALMDVEPMGDEFVIGMCHTIEDPTFDATAWATNPQARMRPIHRPPRTPADRHPHCHWRVKIDEQAEQLDEPEIAVFMRRTQIAQLELSPWELTSPSPGWSDYSHPLLNNLPLEGFSSSVLSLIGQEACVQGQLLAMAFWKAIEKRSNVEEANRIATKQFVGVAGVVAERLKKFFQLNGGLSAISQVINFHPAFLPDSYAGLNAELQGDQLLVDVENLRARAEKLASNWLGLPDPTLGIALQAIAQAVEPRASCSSDSNGHWIIQLGDHLRPESEEVSLTRFSSGATWDFGSADDSRVKIQSLGEQA